MIGTKIRFIRKRKVEWQSEVCESRIERDGDREPDSASKYGD